MVLFYKSTFFLKSRYERPNKHEKLIFDLRVKIKEEKVKHLKTSWTRNERTRFLKKKYEVILSQSQNDAMDRKYVREEGIMKTE